MKKQVEGQPSGLGHGDKTPQSSPEALTANHGKGVSNNQSSLGIGAREYLLLEAHIIDAAHFPKKPMDLPAPPAPALGFAERAETLRGRKIAVLVTDGTDRRWVIDARRGIEGEGAKLVVIAPKASGVEVRGGGRLAADHALRTSPSVLFDAVILAISEDCAQELASDAAAVGWVRDAYAHLKVIGYNEAATALLERAGVASGSDAGVIRLDGADSLKAFLTAAKRHRIWEREPKMRPTG